MSWSRRTRLSFTAWHRFCLEENDGQQICNICCWSDSLEESCSSHTEYRAPHIETCWQRYCCIHPPTIVIWQLNLVPFLHKTLLPVIQRDKQYGHVNTDWLILWRRFLKNSLWSSRPGGDACGSLKNDVTGKKIQRKHTLTLNWLNWIRLFCFRTLSVVAPLVECNVYGTF